MLVKQDGRPERIDITRNYGNPRSAMVGNNPDFPKIKSSKTIQSIYGPAYIWSRTILCKYSGSGLEAFGVGVSLNFPVSKHGNLEADIWSFLEWDIRRLTRSDAPDLGVQNLRVSQKGRSAWSYQVR